MTFDSCCRIIYALGGFIGMLLIGPIITFNMAWFGLLDILNEKERGNFAVQCFICLFGFFSSLAYYTCFAFVFMVGYFLFVMVLLIDECRDCKNFDCAKALIEPSMLGLVFSKWVYGPDLDD